MRRRRVRPDGDSVPERLARFDPDEWGGAADELAYRKWKAARRQWVAEGHARPGGEEAMDAEEFEACKLIPDAPIAPEDLYQVRDRVVHPYDWRG